MREAQAKAKLQKKNLNKYEHLHIPYIGKVEVHHKSSGTYKIEDLRGKNKS